MPLEYDEIIESFVVEATEAVADLETDFLAIEEGGADIDDDLVAKVFRNIHSMKGTAGFCGLDRIGALAHEMENVLNMVRNKELVPTPGVVEVLLRGADKLTQMVADVLNSNEYDTHALEDELKLIESHGPPEDRDGSETAPAAGGDTPADASDAGGGGGDDSGDDGDDDEGGGEEWPFASDDDEGDYDVELENGTIAFLCIPKAQMNEHRREGRSIHVITVDLFQQDADADRTPTDVVSAFGEHGSILQAYVSTGPVPPLDVGEADELPFVALFATEVAEEDLAETLGIDEEAIELVADPAGAVHEEHEPAEAQAPEAEQAPEAGTPAAAAAADAPEPAAAPAAAAAAPAAAKPDPKKPAEKAEAPKIEQYLRVSVTNLDTLMNLAGELVLSRNQLLQASTSVVDAKDDDGEENLDSIANRIDRITSELQEAIMQTRMQPVGSVFNKFPRIVRDLAKQLGKQIELDVHGKEVELDKSIIEAIGDPLTHLIRNACDHGVETPEKRAETGKGPEGTVILKAFHQAGKVFITIEDDGAGINADRMRSKAVEKGLMTEEAAAELPDLEAQMLIFHAGFSTAEQVTDVSGRGVGMDVVRTNIEALGGSIEIDSKVGRGSIFRIQLPLTLAIIPSLVVVDGANCYAIPQTNISELIRVKPEDIAGRIGRINDAEVLRLRGDLLPLIKLSAAVDDGRSAEEYANARNAGKRMQHDEEEAAQVDAPTASTGTPDATAPLADAPTVETGQMLDVAGAEGVADPAADAGPAAEAPTIENEVTPEVATDPAAVDPPGHEEPPPGFQPTELVDDREAVSIIVVEAGTLRYGLVVDEVADSQEIVVKPLGRHMKDCHLLAGATVLGDGTVALILDLTGVADEGRLDKTADRVETDSNEGDGEFMTETQSSLLFTNNDEELFAVPTALISRIERIEASQIENIGGKDFLQYGGRALPLMSLENHISALPRAEQDHYHVVVFTFGGADMGLIAPHLVDIRGIPTDVDQDTFVENGVIGSIIENDRAIRIIDVLTLGRAAFPDRFEDDSPLGAAGGVPTTILLAEDSNFFRAQVTSFLSAEGYEVVGCEDGQIAWQVLQDPSRTFDMVLTDIEMPNMNGYELTRSIRSDPMFAHLPVIGLSSLSSDEDVKRAKDAGVNAYQIKMDRESLLEDIKTILEEARDRAGLGATTSAQGVPA